MTDATKKRIKPDRPIYPSPAGLVTSAGPDGEVNVVTLGEIFNVSIARPVIVGIAIRTATHSHGLIRAGGEFTVNLPTTDLLETVDAVGSISGRECDKFERFGLTPLPASVVRPPLIAECPVNVECRVLDEREVGDHQLFLGEAVAEHVEEAVLGEDGSPDPDRLDMLIYAFGRYFAAGEPLGTHGFTGAEGAAEA
jgi:flavin reductase (DIM6/NTAB) family NADH-FMN oxidoreductase RutF